MTTGDEPVVPDDFEGRVSHSFVLLYSCYYWNWDGLKFFEIFFLSSFSFFFSFEIKMVFTIFR